MSFTYWKKVDIYHILRANTTAFSEELINNIERVFFSVNNSETQLFHAENLGTRSGFDVENFFLNLAKKICNIQSIPDWSKNETTYTFRNTHSEPNFVFPCKIIIFNWTHEGNKYQFREKADLSDRYGYSLVWWFCKNMHLNESPNYDIDSRRIDANCFTVLNSLHQRMLRLEEAGKIR